MLGLVPCKPPRKHFSLLRHIPPLAGELGVDPLGALVGGEQSRALTLLGIPAAGFRTAD